MKCAEFLFFGIVAISFISLCEGKVLTKSSLLAPDIPKETESFSIPPAKQRFAGRTGNINSDLQKRLDYTNPAAEEHHMDTKHGVFSGDSPIVISQESGSLETFGRALRQAADADDEETCLHDLQPCRKHKQCCGGYCNWGIGLKCLSN